MMGPRCWLATLVDMVQPGKGKQRRDDVNAKDGDEEMAFGKVTGRC